MKTNSYKNALLAGAAFGCAIAFVTPQAVQAATGNTTIMPVTHVCALVESGACDGGATNGAISWNGANTPLASDFVAGKSAPGGYSVYAIDVPCNAPGAPGCVRACRYIKNNGANAIFVPFKLPNEWYAFIQYHPGYVDLANCARPTTKNMTPDDNCSNPSPASVPISLQYGRQGAVITQSKDFKCSDGSTETVTATFTAGQSPDTANPDSGWQMELSYSTPTPPKSDAACGSAVTSKKSYVSGPPDDSELCAPGNTSSIPQSEGVDNKTGAYWWQWTCTSGSTVTCKVPVCQCAMCPASTLTDPAHTPIDQLCFNGQAFNFGTSADPKYVFQQKNGHLDGAPVQWYWDCRVPPPGGSDGNGDEHDCWAPVK